MSEKQNNWRLEKRQKIEGFFIEANLVAGSHSEIKSPSGLFSVGVDDYSTGPHTWQYSRGIVTHIGNRKIIADVKRNYADFWHSWVQHANGQEYLLCGEDYQGYTVVDLVKAEIKNYLPDSAEKGNGFCWVKVYPSPGAAILAVEGCYWACPYEIVFYDFSEPLKLPLPEIGRISEMENIVGWETATTFAVEHVSLSRNSDGKNFDSLSEAEQAEYDKDNKLFSSSTKILRWNSLTRNLVT